MITPKEFGKSYGSDYSDHMDDELIIPETDAKKRKIGCYTCIAVCVIFWSLIIYIIA